MRLTQSLDINISPLFGYIFLKENINKLMLLIYLLNSLL